MPPSNLQERLRWLISALTPLCPDTYAARSGKKIELYCRWNHSPLEVWVDIVHPYAPWADRVPWENLLDCQMLEGRGAGVKCLRQSCLLHVLVLLEALCYARCRGHGVHKRRLVQPWDSVCDLTLFYIHQRCPGNWDPSSSFSSETDLSLTISSVSNSVEKSTGEASLGAESEEEDLLIRDREWVESLDLSIPLEHLTGVLGRLSGVLECLTGVLDRLGGVWSSLVIGVWSTGLDWVTGAGKPKSILRCIKVHIDIKSTKLAWSMFLGRDGNSKLLTSETMDASCTAAGVFSAGVPWATSLAKSSTAESCGCAESSTAGSCGCAESTPARSCSCAGLATPAG